MAVMVVLAVSIALQLLAAILALRLIRVTRPHSAWILIALAVGLMASRRMVTFYRLITGDVAKPPDITAEVIALVISVLMVSGIALIGPYFARARENESRIRQSEIQFRLLAQNAQDLIYRYRISPKQAVDYVSPSAEAITGYSQEDYYADPSIFLTLAHPDDRARIEPILNGNGDEVSRVTMRWIRKDGTQIWTELHNIAVRNESGETVAIEGVARDITERVATEEALRESEEKFRNLAEQSPNMIFILQDGRVVYANKRCEEIMGYSREELYSPDFSFMTLIAPGSVEFVLDAYRTHMRGQDVPPYEYELLTKDGRRVVGINTTRLISFGGANAILGVITDITQRIATELSLERALAKHYLDVAGVVMLVIDRDQSIKMMNRKGCEVLGCQEHEVINTNWFDEFVPARYREEAKASFERMISGQGDECLGVESLVRTWDGDERMIAWYNTVLIDGEGRPTGLLSSGEDITERCRIEDTLRASEARYRTLFNSGQDAIFVYGIEDGLPGVFIEVNDIACERLGYARSELLQMRPKDIDAEGSTTDAGEIVTDLLDTGTALFESTFLTRDGWQIPVEINARTFQIASQEFVLSIARDTSGRTSTETGQPGDYSDRAESASDERNDGLDGLERKHVV